MEKARKNSRYHEWSVKGDSGEKRAIGKFRNFLGIT